MSLIAIIGGSGFDTYDDLTVKDAVIQETPYGAHSSPIFVGTLRTSPCLFLPRHGGGHILPPHKVNYRANIWMLKQLGVTHIIACNVVGGITETMSPNTIVIPDQIIDYTYEREHTFYDGKQSQQLGENFQGLKHTDFSYPYSEELRNKVISFFQQSPLDCIGHGVYGCTQGPRLETAAEIQCIKRDGCDIVGMTGMPEAALAREIGIDYVSIALVVNWAAGVKQEDLSVVEIMNTIKKSMGQIKQLLPDILHFL
jgi:5'-deoxy-5'-methylthioadenosine phosphorylase